MEGNNRCASAGFDEPIFINEDREVPIFLNFSKLNCIENNIFAGSQYASIQGSFTNLS